MSKIGDLIVRLKLQYQDYQKGLKHADKETKGFAASLGKIKGIGLAVWGAIGASAVAFGKQLINSSQAIGDAWNRMTSQIKAGWDVFVQSVGAWNWNNFIGRIKEATVAAKALTNALDAEFEVSNSIKLQKAAMAEELAALEVLARDQNKTYEERAAAAKKYLDMVKPLYDQELMLAKKLEDAHLGKFLAGSGLQDTEQVRQDLKKFLVDIGKIPTLLDDLAALSSAQKTTDKGANVFGSNYKKLNAAYDVRNQMRSKLKAVQSEYQTDLVALFRAYNDMRGDEDAKPMVDAMIRAGEAAGAFNRETKRMQNALNSSLSQIEDDNLKRNLATAMAEIEAETEKALSNLEDAFDVEIEGPKFDFSNLEDGLAEMQQYLADWEAEQEEIARLNDILENTIVASLSGATQALTDSLMGIEGADASQVLSALLEPFARTMTQMGEMLIIQGLGIEAFKESLIDLNGPKAIAAGAALLAMGAALSSGIRALGGAGSGTTSTTGASASYGSNSSLDLYQQEITVKVVGELAGDKIILAGQNTLNKWNR